MPKNFTRKLLVRQVPDFKYALSLNGTTSLIPITLNSGLALTVNEDFTISFWHRGALDGGYIWSQDKASSSFGPNFRLVANSNGTVQFYIRNDANTVAKDQASNNAYLKAGFWQHFCFTHTQLAGNLYIDGRDVNNAGNWNHGAAGTSTFDKMTFGAQVRASTGAYHKGDYTEIAIIKRVLSITEAKDIWARGKYPSDAKTLYLPALEGYGTTSTDKSGNGNSATLTNVQWIQCSAKFNGQINQ
jgi:hypothetical protein